MEKGPPSGGPFAYGSLRTQMEAVSDTPPQKFVSSS